MKTRFLFKLSTYSILAVYLTACSSTTYLSEQEKKLSPEESIQQQLEDINITEDAAELLSTETNEVLIREELVCRNETKLGTRFKKKVCRTQAELDAIEANARRETITAQRLNSMDKK